MFDPKDPLNIPAKTTPGVIVPSVRVGLQIGPLQRPAAIEIPKDMTDEEFISLIAEAMLIWATIKAERSSTGIVRP